MIAAIAASKVKPKKIYLCSLSPYFKEDIDTLVKKSERRTLGKRRLADFQSIYFNDVAKSIHCETVVFVGMKEPASVIKRAKEAHHKIKHAHLHKIEEATHDLLSPAYIRAIHKII